MGAKIRNENYRTVDSLLPIFELLETSTNVGAKEEALRILAHISTDKECRSAIRYAFDLSVPRRTSSTDKRVESDSWSNS